MPKILKMLDKSDDFTTHKDLLPDLPFRGILVAKTGSGKTSAIGSLLLLEEFYLNEFSGDDIYIFSPLKNDYKMETIIKVKEIPEGNIYRGFDDEILGMTYDKLADEFENAVTLGDKPTNKLVILDDLSFSGDLRKGTYNNVARVFQNGRKMLISCLVTTQFYHSILPAVRENASFLMVFNTSLRQLESIAEEHNYLESKKKFIKMFRENVKERHDFIVVNHSNEAINLYLDKNFESIIPKMISNER